MAPCDIFRKKACSACRTSNGSKILASFSGLCPARKLWHLKHMRSLLYRSPVTVVTVFAFCLFCLPAHGQTLTSMGPVGGDVRTLVGDPLRPNLLYLGTPDGYVFGSPDAGKRWQAL